MYKKILVALENSSADQTLIPHITQLAKLHGSTLILMHVADGWAARFYDELLLKESEEMKKDRAYLEETAATLRNQGLKVNTLLAHGDPPQEILNIANKEACDLIAMTSHGHRFIADMIYGSTIEKVRHEASVPILVLKAQADL